MLEKLLITLGITIISLYGFFCLLVASVAKSQKVLIDRDSLIMSWFFRVSQIIGNVIALLFIFGICFVVVFFLVYG
jgi:hypothetical protein